MTGAVGSRLINWTAGMNASVQIDYVVVAYFLQALLAVPAVQILDCVSAAGWSGAAVDYYFCYLSHIMVLLRVVVTLNSLDFNCSTVAL